LCDPGDESAQGHRARAGARPYLPGLPISGIQIALHAAAEIHHRMPLILAPGD
jgi:hypothetical protein